MEETVCPELTADERDLWCAEIERRCGVYYSATRTFALRRALWQGMNRSGVASYREYYRLVSSGVGEWTALIDSILNRETCFFRHAPSFAALSSDLLPRLAAAGGWRGGEPLALWSAGCSSGEEAYSIAIAAHQALRPCFAPFAVLGSDLSSQALAAARQGRYGPRAADDVPESLLARYFVREDGQYLVGQAIRAAVRFERFNFIDAATYPSAPQDVIFCQNVLIYFREPVRSRVAAALAERLRPGGYLVAGPGELTGVRLPGLVCQPFGETAVLWRA